MEHLALWIYLFGISENLSVFLQAFGGVSAFFGTLFLWGYALCGSFPPSDYSCYSEKEKQNNMDAYEKRKIWLPRSAKILLPVGLIFMFIGNIIPSRSTIAAMIIIPKIATNKDVQQLPANVAKTLNDAVVAWGKDLLPKKDK